MPESLTKIYPIPAGLKCKMVINFTKSAHFRIKSYLYKAVGGWTHKILNFSPKCSSKDALIRKKSPTLSGDFS